VKYRIGWLLYTTTLLGTINTQSRGILHVLYDQNEGMFGKRNLDIVLHYVISEQQYEEAQRKVYINVSAVGNTSKSHLSIRHDWVGLIYAYIKHEVMDFTYVYLQGMKIEWTDFKLVIEGGNQNNGTKG